MDTLSKEQTNKIQMEKLFNSSEGVIKEWVAGFVDKPADELFDTITPVEPIVFYPSDKTDGKYMEFKLQVVPFDYKANLGDDILEEKLIVDTIHFFVYSMRVVYGSIMKTSERGLAHDVCMEWDSESMTFYPKYFPDIKKKRDYLNYVFGHMMNAKQNLPDDKVEEWSKDFAELSKDLADASKTMEEEKIEEKIETKSLEWANRDRIGIVVKYLTQEEVSSKVQAQVKPVSAQQYEDPPEEQNGLNKMETMMESLRDILKEDEDSSSLDKKEPSSLDKKEPSSLDKKEPSSPKYSEKEQESTTDDSDDSDDSDDASDSDSLTINIDTLVADLD